MGKRYQIAGRTINPRSKRMRVVKFDKGPVADRAFWILWLAVAQHPAGNREQTALGLKVYETLKTGSEPAEEGSNLLKPIGLDMYFEENEFKILKESLEKFRTNVTLAGADALVYLDALLDAPSLTPEQLAAKQKGD